MVPAPTAGTFTRDCCSRFCSHQCSVAESSPEKPLNHPGPPGTSLTAR